MSRLRDAPDFCALAWPDAASATTISITTPKIRCISCLLCCAAARVRAKTQCEIYAHRANSAIALRTQRPLLGLNLRRARRAVGADDLNHDFTVFRPHEVWLPGRLGPDAAGRHYFHPALVELFAVADQQRARNHHPHPLIRMEMRLHFVIGGKPR